MKGFVLSSESNDLLVEHGAAAIRDNEAQICENVIVAVRGEMKEIPLIGGEVRFLLGGARDVMWPTRTKKMIQSCGVEISKVSISDDDTVTVE
ncbi:MAG: hypothetical protein LUC33_04530 [Prevotellaceae bacterium]|nr:hypothetical protein [Prevotellaceae bacterium]